MVEIEVIKGDITEIECDAIVNPANSQMYMGGGVASAIKRKGGEQIEKEARKHAPVPIGKAIVTNAGRLKAKAVIHSPTMEYLAMKTTYEKVLKAIKAALIEAIKQGFECIAFPGMGTGVGGLESKKCARAFKQAFEELQNEIARSSLKKIILVAYTNDLYLALRSLSYK